MNTIDQKRATYDKWFKICLVALAALIVSPIIFMVVKGIVGLVIAAALGLIVVNFAPVVSMKLANWKVKGIVSEAKENPIETLTNLLIAKRQAFNSFQVAVTEQVSALKNFERKSNEFAKLYPARAKEFQMQVAAMTTMVDKQQNALSEAKVAIAHGDQKLVEMRAYWEMSQIAQAANKTANMSTGDQYSQLKADTAFDSVFDSVNMAFAQMEVAARLETPALANNASPTLDSLNIFSVDSKVRVQ